MALTFHEVSCVIAGTFNIYIIRPDWLGKIGLLPEGSAVRFETKMNQPGFRMRSSNMGAEWIVTPNKLILQTNSAVEDCGQTIDRILESLPWTPLMALGFNFLFRGKPADITEWDSKTRFPDQSVPDRYVRKQRSWHIGLQRESQIFNLHLIEMDDYIEVRSNVHTELHNQEVSFARDTARGFFQHRDESVSLIREFFNATIDDPAQ